MSIDRHGSRYRVRLTIANKQITKTFTTQKEAEEFEYLTRQTNPTLAYVLDKWTRLVCPNLKGGTHYTRAISEFVAFIGPECQIQSISKAQARNFLISQLDKVAGATVNRKQAYLRSFWNWAIAYDYALINPFILPRLAREKQRGHALTNTELTRLLTYLSACSPVMVAFVKMALISGARAGELQRLTWDDIDHERQLAILRHTKNDRPRTIPIDLSIIESLPRSGNFVFPGSPGKPFVYTATWQRLRVKAGLPNLRFHDLRHTAITRFIVSGGTLFQAMQAFGHLDPKMTHRYTHLSSDAHHEILRRSGIQLV